MNLRTNLKIFYFSYYSIVVYLIMLFPMQLQKFYEPSQIGIIVGSITFFKFLSLTLFKKVKFTRNILFWMNNLFILSIILIYIFQENFYLVVLFSALFGIINNFVISYFDQIKIKTYRKYLGLFRVYGSFGGFSLFILVIFFKSLVDDISYLFYFYIVIYFICSNMILYQRKRVLKLEVIESETTSTQNANAYWVIGGAVMIVMSFFHAFIGIYLKQFGYSTVDTSILLSIGIFFEIIAFYIAHYLFNRFDYKTLFYVASLVTGFRLVFFDMFVENFVILGITQALHFFTFGLFYASFMNILKNVYKTNINKALQIFNGYIDGVLKSLFIFVFAYLLYHGVFLILGLVIILCCLFYHKRIFSKAI